MGDNGNEFMVILSFPMANVFFASSLTGACLFFVFVVNPTIRPLRVSRSRLLDSI